MLISLAYMILLGMMLAFICKKLHLPGLMGMIFTGIILGPGMLDLIDASVLGISAELRKIALIIILTRAGLSLNPEDLKKVGRPALLMCFLPALFEIAGMVMIAPNLFDVDIIEAALMGAVVAAVSPAVIVPKMIKLIEEGYGVNKSIPQLILAGASVDDVFVIVFFTSFLGLAKGENLKLEQFARIPVSIVLGVIAGGVIGYLFTVFFKMIHNRDTVKIAIMMCVSFILVTLEDRLDYTITFSALIAIMFIGIVIKSKMENVAIRLQNKFNKMWVVAEIILFVLIGACIDIRFAIAKGPAVIVLLFAVLAFRMIGVLLCLAGSSLNKKERMFCMFAYMPKATVQASIGGIPLAAGLGCGKLILTVAVVAIIISAPLGAFLIENTYKKLLTTDENG